MRDWCRLFFGPHDKPAASDIARQVNDMLDRIHIQVQARLAERQRAEEGGDADAGTPASEDGRGRR